MKACQLAIALPIASLCAYGAVFEFDFQPGGMTSFNQRPTPTISDASANELANLPSIALDTGNHTLFLNFAWGAVNGFTDLNAPFAAAQIRGPATVNTTGSYLYNLTPLVQQQSPVAGGIFGLSLQLQDRSGYTVAQQETDLLNSRWYISVYSQKDAINEIRGQLTVVPEPQTYMVLSAAGMACFALVRRFNRKG